ncbi:putative contactin-3-like, partial [Triplophysa rosa]
QITITEDEGSVSEEITCTAVTADHQIQQTIQGHYALLISDLTEEDEGLYSCWINKNQHKNFRLAVKGCVVSESNETMTSHPGRSVLLSCTCEDDQTKAKHFKWRRADLNKRIVSETEKRIIRVDSEWKSDKQVTGSESLFMSILITGLMMLMVLGSALCIYWRCVT